MKGGEIECRALGCCWLDSSKNGRVNGRRLRVPGPFVYLGSFFVLVEFGLWCHQRGGGDDDTLE